MRSDIRKKMYQEEYKKINDLYCEKHLNITKACEKIGISPRKYHTICKELGKPSVAQEKETTTKMKTKSKHNQKGGDNNENPSNNNENPCNNNENPINNNVKPSNNNVNFIEKTLINNAKNETPEQRQERKNRQNKMLAISKANEYPQ